MRFRPLLAVAAAAGLLAAGCDYWRNLVDGKTAATAHLKVKVRDKFTGEHLFAVCTDSNHGLTLETSERDGQAETRSAGTGKYTMRCNAPWGYYDKVASFPLTPAGDTVVFDLARLGGEWYKDHPTRAVRIREKFDTLWYPLDLDFNANPQDSTQTARFWYLWTFAKAKGLDRGDSTSTESVYPYFRKRVEAVNVVPGPDTLTLRVWSNLNGSVPYYIGMDQRPFVWALDYRPKLVMQALNPTQTYPVGCVNIYQPLRVFFRGVDPDGECKSVRFYTDDSLSAFGAVDTTLPCFENSVKEGRIYFDLKDRYDYLLGDTTILRDNILNIIVTDDDDEFHKTYIKIITRSNRPPTVDWGIVGSRIAMTKDSIKVWFQASDSDGKPKEAILNWIGEGESRVDYMSKPEVEPAVPDTAVWNFLTPGIKYFKLFVTDNCNGWVNTAIDSIIVRDNRPPKVGLEYMWYEAAAQNPHHVFDLTIEDKDISEGLNDTITEVHVNWNREGSQLVASPNSRSIFYKRLTHQFSNPPDSLGRYLIEIRAQDARGSGRLDTLILIP